MESADSLLGIEEFLDSEANNECDEPWTPIAFTEPKGSSPLTALKIEYCDDLPEYPISDVNGYAYIVSIKRQSPDEMRHVVDGIQYAKRQRYQPKQPIYCPFLKCHVNKLTWKCSGILACEFLNPYLKSYQHTSVDDHIWELIQKSMDDAKLIESNESRRHAYSCYRAHCSRFKQKVACLEPLESCRPVYKRFPIPNVHGEHDPYIGCINESYGPLPRHYRATVLGHSVLNLQFLEDLFNKGVIPPTEECNVIEPLKTRRGYCDRDHPQGPGKLEKALCDVQFNAFIPVDTNLCPYLVFISHGVHQHPPPPPTKAPEQILQGVERIIAEMRDPSLTTAQFLRSPQLEAFCNSYNTSTLTEIHASFSNKEKISALIQKQRVLSYPQGQSVNGLIFLRNTSPIIREYIQDIYCEEGNILIICAFQKQLELLSQQSSFQVDMSFKRLRSKHLNEVVFATFLPDQHKVITFCRVITNMDSTEGYHLLFKKVFSIITRITGRPVLFDHIHLAGIHGIIVDMDTKQYTGLGKYLQQIDSKHRDWRWQLQHSIVFCHIHFQRTILRAIGTQSKGSGVYQRMMGLLGCQSEEESVGNCLLTTCTAYEDAKVHNWARAKRDPVIKAGLNRACSKIRPCFLDELYTHTNAVEQSHNKSYASGKDLTLTEAVKNSSKLDKDDILQYIYFKQYHTHHSSRTTHQTASYTNHIVRSGSQKRQHSTSSSDSNTGSQSAKSLRLSNSQAPQSVNHDSLSSLQRTAAVNAGSLEQRRQELELKKMEVEINEKERESQMRIKAQEQEIHREQLESEKLELDLMERRLKIQKEQDTT